MIAVGKQKTHVKKQSTPTKKRYLKNPSICTTFGDIFNIALGKKCAAGCTCAKDKEDVI